MTATIIDGSGNTSFQLGNSWLAVIRRMRRSYQFEQHARLGLVLTYVRQVIRDDLLETVQLAEHRRQLKALASEGCQRSPSFLHKARTCYLA